MNLTPAKMNRGAKIISVIAVVLLWILVREQIAQMDERFFQSSQSGIKGLALYLIGDYHGAAKAYRAHFQEEALAGQTSGDPARDAFMRGDLKIAKELALKSFAQNQKDVEHLLMAGEIELEEHQSAQALSRFTTVLQKDPRNLDALLLAAYAYTFLNDYDQAIDKFKLALRPNNIGSYGTGFLIALQTTGELASRSNDEQPLCLLAHYYRYLRIFDPSNARLGVAYANKAIISGDRPDDGYLTRGVFSHFEGDQEAALSDFLKATEINPHNAEAYRWASRVYPRLTGDLVKEYSMLKGAYEAAPDDPFYAGVFSEFLAGRIGDLPQALTIDLTILARWPENPDTPDVLRRVGFLYTWLGEQERAIAYYQKALARQPNNPEIYEEIGFSLDQLGKVEEAIAAYRKALAMAPNRADNYLRISGIYRKEYRFREAIREEEEAFRMGLRDIESWTRLCDLYTQVKEELRAEACYKQVHATGFRNSLPFFLSFTQ